jgi:mannose-6-phosphate isomerase-like protein (cupin superfamily)
MSDTLEPVILGPGEGAAVENPVGGTIVLKVGGAQSGGALTVLETVVAPGEGPAHHVHEGEDEGWYALEGDLRFRLGDDILPAPAGSFVFVPRRVPHCFQNVGEGPARVLVTFTPSGMERFFERFAELVIHGDGAESFRAAGAETGMEVLGPPLARSHPR